MNETFISGANKRSSEVHIDPFKMYENDFWIERGWDDPLVDSFHSGSTIADFAEN